MTRSEPHFSLYNPEGGGGVGAARAGQGQEGGGRGEDEEKEGLWMKEHTVRGTLRIPYSIQREKPI